MPAPILLGILSITGTELGKQIGLASISFGTQKVWGLLVTDANTQKFDELSRKLDQVIGDLGKVRTAISEVKTQIDDFHVDYKMDEVDRQANQIDSLYDQYTAAMDALVQAVKDDAAGVATAKAARTRATQRLTELGNRVTNEIYQSVKQINSLLAETGDRSLLALVNRTSIGRDFLSYYCNVKSVFIRYFIVQAKALFIMNLVNDDPAVPFADGSRLIQNVKDMMEKQESYLASLVPGTVVALVRALAAQPKDTPIHVYAAKAGRGLHFGSMMYGSIMTLADDRVNEWRLEAMQPVDNPDPKRDYHFLMTNVPTGKSLILSGNSYGAVADDGRRMGWKIRAALDGSFWLEFKGTYSRGAFENYRLTTRDVEHSTPQLYYSATADDTDVAQKFHIRPYVDAFKDTNIMRAREYMTPGCYLESNNKSYRLYYQKNGQIEIVHMPDGKVVWCPVYLVQNAWRLIMQEDGNFVAYGAPDRPYWASGQYFKELWNYYYAILRLRDDGKIETVDKEGKVYWVSP